MVSTFCKTKHAVWVNGRLSSIPERQSFEPVCKFADEVFTRGGRIFPIEELKTLYSCIQCGACVGVCPSGRRTALRLRSIITKIQLGLRDDVLNADELWMCTTCYTCQERCPRKVAATDVIRIIRNIAFENGHAKERHIAVAKNLIKTGHSIPITEQVKEVRAKLGLQPLPPTSLTSKEALDEVNEIMRISGFHSKVKKYG